MLYFLQAEGAKGVGGMNFQFLGIMLLMFAVMWFFMIRPQQKKQKEIREMRKLLQKGDRVITQGGIYGKITEVKDSHFLVEIADNVKVKISKELVFKDTGDASQ